MHDTPHTLRQTGCPAPDRRWAPALLLPLLLPWLLLASVVGRAEDAGDRDTTDAAAEQAIRLMLEARVGHEAHAVTVEISDSTARLGDCIHPAPFLPREDTPLWGRVTVAVACDNPPSPRYLQTRVIAEGHYLVAATDIQPGTLVEPWMLTTATGDLGSLSPRILRDPDAARGMEARQRISEGAPVQEHQLRAPLLVNRGQTVVIEARGPGFRINREGEALDAGGLGESVRVRLSRQQTITATVSGSGRVSTMEQ